MPKMYGSMLCPDCIEARVHLKKIGYEYEFIDITESMINLKEFLYLRDSREEFIKIKSLKHIGIPTILTNDNKIIVEQDVLKLK